VITGCWIQARGGGIVREQRWPFASQQRILFGVKTSASFSAIQFVAGADGRRKPRAVPLIAANETQEAVERAKALLDQLGLNGGATHCPPRCLRRAATRGDRAALVHEPRWSSATSRLPRLDHATGEL